MVKITLSYFISLALSFFHTHHLRASKSLGHNSFNVFAKALAFISVEPQLDQSLATKCRGK